MSRLSASFVVLVLLASCQSSPDQVRQLTGAGALRVEEASRTGVGYDYTVVIRDVKGLGYDPDSRAEREALAGRAAGPTCAAPLVVREDVMATGQVALGTSGRSYFLRIRCRPA